MGDRSGRPWFAVTAVAVALGLVINLFVAADATGGHFQTGTQRALNVFAFFTVQSNLIVGFTTAMLALRPGRRSPVFDTFRLTGVVAIAITGVVYHVALARLLDLDSWALAGDQLLHTFVPIMAVAGWLLFGPRGRARRRVATYTVIFPLAWFAFTLIRGAAIDWYPYPFIDVTTLGYARVLVNAVWISVLWLGVAGGAVLADRALVRSAARRADEADRTVTATP